MSIIDRCFDTDPYCSIDKKEMPVPTVAVVTVITVVPKSYFIYFHCYGCF